MNPKDAADAIRRIEKQLLSIRRSTQLFVEKYREWSASQPNRYQEWR